MELRFTLDNHIPDFLQAIEGKIDGQLLAAANMLHGKLVENLSGQRSGHRYKLPNTKNVYYNASRPFEYPAWRTGHLAQTYTSFVEGTGYNAQGIIASPLEYSVYLEYGTSKMAMRPHLRKTMYNNKSEIEEIVRGIFE